MLQLIAAGQDPVIPATNVDWAQAPFVFKQFGEDDGHTFSCPSIGSGPI